MRTKAIVAPGAHTAQAILFLDDRHVESMTGLARQMHPARLYPHNPVIKADRAWEGDSMDCSLIYPSVIYNPSKRLFEMWYNARGDLSAAHFVVCYATSQDGLHWEKPVLNVLPVNQVREHLNVPSVPPWFIGTIKPSDLPDLNRKFKESINGNNIVLLGSGLPDYRQALLGGVVYCPWESDSSRRYKMLFWDNSHRLQFSGGPGAGGQTGFYGVFAAFSPDGIHWSVHPGTAVLEASDVINVAWDSQLQRYVAHFKIWQLLPKPQPGKTIISTPPLQFAPTYDEPHQVSLGVWEMRGPFWDTDGVAPAADRVKTVHIENCDSVDSRRVVGRAESRDFIHWTKYRVCLLPDELDGGKQTYGMPAFVYEGVWVGLPRIFDSTRREAPVDTQLAFSHDDIEWYRTPDRQPFIPRTPGAWDGGWVGAANAPVVVGDELWFYYCAFEEGETVPNAGAIGLAKLRRDGFASLVARDMEGTVTTQPIKVTGRCLELNIDAVAGSVKVEILDARGRVVRGFSRSTCRALTGDSVHARATWAGGWDLRHLRGKPVRVKVYMRNANLYALRFRDP